MKIRKQLEVNNREEETMGNRRINNKRQEGICRSRTAGVAGLQDYRDCRITGLQDLQGYRQDCRTE
ncbi:MAG: hypothetical protein GX754_12215 [Clostridiaceae bacterium]|nr:hypothetical protein [Clostridiaceae bacterium]